MARCGRSLEQRGHEDLKAAHKGQSPRKSIVNTLDRPSTWAYLTYRLFNRKVYCMSPDRLNTTFAALADPTRRSILARLASGKASVMELAEPFAMSLPAISKHLKVLENTGLIARGREAQWRPCRLERKALKVVDDWLGRYRQFWEERLDRLEEYLNKLKAEGDDQHGTRTRGSSNKKAHSQQ